MSTRHNNGSHYENHQRAAELHGAAARAHGSAEVQHGKEEHLTGHEHSRQAREHTWEAHLNTEGATTGHGVIAFGDDEIATLAYEFWEAGGRQKGSQQEDWFHAVKELRSRHAA